MKRTALLITLIAASTLIAFGQIPTTTSKDCYIVYEFDGKAFLKNKKIKKGSPIVVFGEFKDFNTFYTIEYKNIKGCIKEDCVTINKKISKLFQIKADRINAEVTREEKADSSYMEMAKKHKETMVEESKTRYGRWYIYINARQVSIGMPEEFIETALGKPSQINKSQYSFGTRAQYVYKDMYIYTKDGRIEAISKTETN